MKNKEIFDRVSDMEMQLGELYEQLGELKGRLGELLEENYRLGMENHNLRNHLDHTQEKMGQITNEKDSVQKKLPGEGYDNLARLYDEGFHICNLEFGSPRQDQDCMFCLEFFNK